MKRLRSNGSLIAGLILITGLLLLLVLPYVVELKDPGESTLRMQVNGQSQSAPFRPGEAGYLLGSDQAGRDLLSRIVYGARLTLGFALGALLVRALLAIPLGLLGGWYGGWTARVIRGFSAGFSAIPSLVLVVFILSTVQRFMPSSARPYLYFAVVALIGVPRLLEQVRQLAVNIRQQPHIEAAVATGAGTGRILRRHILPLIRSDLLVALSAEISWILIMMGHLAIFEVFLGSRRVFPVFPRSVILEDLAEWAQMLGVNRHALRTYPWIPLYPALALGMTVLAFQLLADGLRRLSARNG